MSTYTVSFDETIHIISVTVCGKTTPDEHSIMHSEIIQLCKEKHCSSLFVDLRELNTSLHSFPDFIIIGESLAKALPGLRVATVLPKNSKSKADIEFTATVAANRGVICKEFENIDEAKKWLLKKT